MENKEIIIDEYEKEYPTQSYDRSMLKTAYEKVVLNAMERAGGKDALIEYIENSIDHYLESEKIRASVNDYGQALYYNHRRGALQDLLAWVRIEEENTKTT